MERVRDKDQSVGRRMHFVSLRYPSSFETFRSETKHFCGAATSVSVSKPDCILLQSSASAHTCLPHTSRPSANTLKLHVDRRWSMVDDEGLVIARKKVWLACWHLSTKYPPNPQLSAKPYERMRRKKKKSRLQQTILRVSFRRRRRLNVRWQFFYHPTKIESFPSLGDAMVWKVLYIPTQLLGVFSLCNAELLFSLAAI